jgi:NAD(P)H-hydrate epimerase
LPHRTFDHLQKGILIEENEQPIIIAVDCPSGLDCDTGELDENAIPADETVTFAAAKVGQFRFPGAAAVGSLYVADIGISPKRKELSHIKLELISAGMVKDFLPDRPADSHKGTFGKAFIVAGSTNFIGAAYLAASSAYRVGAGLVTLGVPQGILSPLAGLVPEATWVLLPNNMGVVNKAAAKVTREECSGYQALLVGCGIGDEDDTREFLEDLLTPEGSPQKPPSRGIGLLNLKDEEFAEEEAKSIGELPPLVIDADGLNVLAKIDHWWKRIPKNTILTPHPREFTRLAGIEDTAQIQQNRLAMAQEYAHKWGVVLVLKGAFTVIAAPDGQTAVSPFASAKLATAGTGDVLAGTIVGLLAQGLEPYQAAVAGVWLHGWAGTHGILDHGAVASDVMFALGEALEVVSA